MGTAPDALTWHTSSYSGGSNACVEVASDQFLTYLRDTKNRSDGVLTVDRSGWSALLRRVTSTGH
jgi:hypothetical protein